MDDQFENLNEEDEAWLSDLERRTMDLEHELFDWREARAREFADSSYNHETAPWRATEPRGADARTRHWRTAADDDDAPDGEDDGYFEDEDNVTPIIRTGARPAWPRPRSRLASAQTRTQSLIARGRRSVDQPRLPRSRKLIMAVASALALITVISVLVLRGGPSWPASVATVKGQIAVACQNPDVASEPGQVNFACGKTTSQILWIFALMTSNDNPKYAAGRTGRVGLEPITPTQGGEVAWSLNLHHPYNPYDPVDSLAVAARAVNNIIGGATLTGADGSPAVQAGLEGNPQNCARYTGTAALTLRAGFPAVCAQPVTSSGGQAALVADTYRQWVVGATPQQAYNVGILFQNADNPGNPQVQAILKTLPTSGP